MLETRYIRENADKVREYLKNRKSDFNLDAFLKLDEDRREVLQEVEMLKKERNESSSLIGKYKKEGKDATELLEKMQGVSAKIKELDQKLAEIDEKQLALAYTIPNRLHESTPIGEDEDDNVEENGENLQNLILYLNLMTNLEQLLVFLILKEVQN